MKRIRSIMAFIGIFVGAGFASGQEIMQYFTSFGLWGIAGAFVATLLFGFVGMVLMELGSYYNAESHEDVLEKITHPVLYRIIDIILIFTVFTVGVVMLAGAGSNLNQQFGLPIWIGSALAGILIILIGMMGTDKIVSILSYITPFLIVIVLIISGITLFFADFSFQELDPIARDLTSPISNWFLSGLNYASFNITFGASMVFVMAGQEKQKNAKISGLIGGIGIGILILLNNLTLFATVENVSQYSLPMLALAEYIHPILGFLMAIILFVLIWGTGISMFYSFTTRFSESGSKKFMIILTLAVLVGYGLSFFGFTSLVSAVYPIIGYAGFLLIFALTVGWFRMKKTKQ